MDTPTGASRLFPIIGDPIRYVESPRWLTRTLRQRGHDAVCVPMEVTAHDFATVMTALTATGNVDGLLITLPHKHAAFASCATSTGRAAAFGAVSLMRRNPDGTWHGDMLDGLAFVQAQRERGATIKGRRALLLGAGGAGSGIALELLASGVGELAIHDTDPARIDAVRTAAPSADGAKVHAAASADPTGFDLVFNATPLGMADTDPPPLDVSLLTPAMFVGDVIAGHGDTPLIAAAKAAGCATASGSDMVAAVQDLMANFFLTPQQPQRVARRG